MTEKIQQQRPAARTMEDMLTAMRGPMSEALPKHMHPDRMLRLATTAMRTNKDLAQCTPASFLGAVMQAAVMGLEINTHAGHAYLVPFKNKGVQECTLIIGYQGMMELARRSGHVRSIYAYPVYKGDVFDYEFGLNPTLKHRPFDGGDKSDANLTHVYAVAKLSNGEPVFSVLTLDDIEYYRSKSKAPTSPFWRDNYPQMAMKTAVRRLYTWLPRSSEMSIAHAVEARADSASQLHATPEVVALLESQGYQVADDEATDATPTPVAPPEQDGQRMKLGKKPIEAPTREPGDEG